MSTIGRVKQRESKTKRPKTSPVVLILQELAPRDEVQLLARDLDQMGAAALIACTTGEVVWNLEGRHAPIVALVIDAADMTADRIALLQHIQESHPMLRRVLLSTKDPDEAIRERVDAVLKKPWTAAAVEDAVRLSRTRL